MAREPFVDEKLLKKIKNWKEDDAPVRTYKRSSTVTKDFVGKTVEVHNGNMFIPVYVREEMIGHCLGEFAPTRKFISHGGQKEKVLTAKKKKKGKV